jgi:hypothetical protein
LLIGRCCNPLGAGAFLADLKSEIIQIQKDFLNKQEKNRPRIPRGPRLNAQERWNGKGAATKRAANGKVGERKESALTQPKRVVPQPSTVWGCSSAGAATPLGAGVISASSVVEHLPAICAARIP